MIRVGPAGWSYSDWKGIVYPSPMPRGFDQLAYLANCFDMIEINATFYRPALKKVAASWVQRVHHQPEFRFTAKLWKRFTHEREERWKRSDVHAVRAGFDQLAEGGVLGAVLIQFPWSFRATEENREWLSDLVREFHDYPLVVEIRHATWDDPAFLSELADEGVGFANIDQPQFKHSLRPTAHMTSSVGYIRVHGRNYKNWFRKDAGPAERYDYLYSAAELRPWANRAVEMAEHNPGADIYVVTNNHVLGKGAANAVMLRAQTGSRPLPIPPPLLAKYPEELKDLGPTASTDSSGQQLLL